MAETTNKKKNVEEIREEKIKLIKPNSNGEIEFVKAYTPGGECGSNTSFLC